MNSVTFSGVIISDKIVLRETPEHTPVTSFMLKVKRDKKRAETQGDLFDIFTVVCWSDMAKVVVSKYKYGETVEVRGSARTGRRQLKDYIIYKDGKQIQNFHIPIFEIYATRIDKLL